MGPCGSQIAKCLAGVYAGLLGYPSLGISHGVGVGKVVG